MTDTDRWGALQVRQLRALTAVVDEGSFGAAARQLGYTQSGVSQQLLALERIVGAPLLVRVPGGRRPPELTEAGRIVLANARPLLRRVGVTQADLDALAGGAAGELTVVTIQSIGARILPAVFAHFRASHPGVQMRIAEASAVETLLASVEGGEADVGFTGLPVRDGPFDIHPLLVDPYVLVTSAEASERKLTDLDRKRLLGIRGCLHDRLVEQRLLAAGIVPAAVERFDDNGMIQALVAAGEGIAVVPQLTVDPRDARISLHPLPELPARELVAIVHCDRRPAPALAPFLAAAFDVCGSMSGSPGASH